MVMVKLMQRSEVSNITQCKLVGILGDIRTRRRLCNTACTRSRLCNTADACCDGACAGHLDMLCIFIYHPVWRKRVWRSVFISAMHSHFVQYFSRSAILRKSVSWHEALVTALQRGLRVHRHGCSALRVGPAFLELMMPPQFRCCEWKELSL